MSTRTIIEINHDHLNRLMGEPEYMQRLLLLLSGTLFVADLNKGSTPEPISGVRILAQRHHSETLKLTIK